MESSIEPRLVGVRKKGKLSEFCDYEIGQSIRVLYHVQDALVTPLRVGTIKQVYD
ncbi:MAG: hypothetical protein JRN52_13425 [Nitrososphaerota archaeon]|nr:hypothetical protein [Nitrososphaerota archaeon]